MDKMSKVYIAGHTGQIGYGLLKRLQADGYKNVTVRSHKELDLLDQESVRCFFKNEQPEYVFYCAGSLGAVDYLENNRAAVVYDNLVKQM